jgi:beta-glucuronidase
MYVKDVNLMKWIGANSMRTSHYPYSEEFLQLCDREGIVVIDECAAVGLHFNLSDSFGIWQPGVNTWDRIKTHHDHKNAICELIARDKNHPCVVMWSISNEASETTPGAYEYFKPMFDLARELDPTRPLTNVSLAGSLSSNDLAAPLVDVVCLNRYYGWYTEQGDLVSARANLEAELNDWVRTYPDKPIIFTEYGADSVSGIHDTTPVMFTEEYQRDFIAAYSASFDLYDNVVGEQVWNFADFYAVQGIKRVQGNKKGIFTRERKPKLAAHWLKERWHRIPDFDYKKGK